jgi:beta-galactosidase
MPRYDELSDPAITGRHRELMHAPWGAYPDAATALAGGASPWQQSLDGLWKFHLAPNPAAAPTGCEGDTFDDRAWADLPVPANWELHGHGTPIYYNVAYPFPPDPPFAPAENPTGCYRTAFALPADWAGKRVFVRFGSVDSAFHLWVNGREVGYNTDSKLPAEFELTAYLRPGRNSLAVRCYRWGAGAYLEKQDYWHLSGIQRSVSLFAKPTVHLRDWAARTVFDRDYRDATVELRAWICRPPGAATILPPLAMIDYTICAGWTIEAQLYDPDGRPLPGGPVRAPLAQRSPMYGPPSTGFHDEAFSAAIRIPVPAARPWTAETPDLYTAVLTLRDAAGNPVDHERVRIGCRQIEVVDGVIRLNGRRLVVRGVNRHEFHPRRGRAVTVADQREDLIAMKRLNFNAVRTCHYPDADAWYDLCDELGMYLVDEANLETHGLEALTTRDPAWAGAYLDRAVRMVLRDRNHPSVVFWSLGNESFHGPHHAAMAAWIRAIDPGRPVQCESGHPGPAFSDVMAPMYPNLDWVRSELAKADERRPMVMCEYVYGKGNSHGNVRKFWDLIAELPRFQGGFAWDWRDKPLECDLPGGGVRWDYGVAGDEAPHTERMCLNGVVGPDLVPHPGAYDLKLAQAPVAIEAEDAATGRLRLVNRHLISDLGHLLVAWSVCDDGRELAAGSLDAPAIAAGASGVCALPLPALPAAAPGAERWLNVRLLLARDLPWAGRGHEICARQFTLLAAAPAPVIAGRSLPALAWDERDGRITARGAGVTVAIDRTSGGIISLTVDGRELIARPFTGCFYRAPTDIDWAVNTNGFAHQWQQAGLDRLVVRSTTVESAALSDRCLRVRIGQELGADSTATSIRRESVILIHGSGDLVIDELAIVAAAANSLPRIGLAGALVGACNRLRWFGRGPHENYSDRKDSALVGSYTATIDDLLTPYAFPQECGGREDVRWAAVTDATGAGLLVQGLPTVHLSALRHRLADLAAAANLADLTPRDETELHIDGHHMGVGGDTGWSQNLHPEFRLLPGRYRWSVRLRPLRPGDDPAVLGRQRLDTAP